MKRDMELVRKILLRIEGAQFGYRPDLKIEGHCEPEIGYNLDLLVQAELVRGKVGWTVDKELLGGSHYRQLSQGAVQLGGWSPAMVLQNERLDGRLDGPLSATQLELEKPLNSLERDGLAYP